MNNNKPRIGVYTICQNESKFVKRWVESMYCNGYGADKAYILDTGSTDNTVNLFKEVLEELKIPNSWLKIDVKVYDSFRFDVARNDNLKMISDEDNLDVLVSIDLDEIMIEDFWNDLRDMVEVHPDFNRIFYMYAWNHNNNGKPKQVFWYDKVHPVKGVRWRYPVHEELVVENPECYGTYTLYEDKIYLHHWPDSSKSRSSYLPLLEVRHQENPDDIYGLYYLMREYMFTDPYSIRALQLATTGYTKAQSSINNYDCLPFFILAMADIYNGWGLKEDAEYFYKKALNIAGHLRQPYISYASFAAYNNKPDLAIKLIDDMERTIPERYSTWYEADYNWTWKPLQIKAVAYCWAGEYNKALKIFKQIKKKYLKTSIDKSEAFANNFYNDYNWLKDFLKKGGK